MNNDAKCEPALRCIHDVCSGPAALLDACEDNNDCSSGMCIAGLCSTSSSTGGPCEETAHCDHLLECSPTDGTCGGLDASCAFNNDLLCNPPLACIQGACLTLHPDGISCVENDDCESMVCIESECAPPSNSGEPCDLNESEDCVSDVECIGDLCGGLGGACINNNDDYCAPIFRCIQGTCQSPSASNGPCDGENSDCTASLVCIGLKCGDPAPAGGICDQNENGDCNFGNCNDHGVCGGEDCYSVCLIHLFINYVQNFR